MKKRQNRTLILCNFRQPSAGMIEAEHGAMYDGILRSI
jgi:hypothetical protein